MGHLKIIYNVKGLLELQFLPSSLASQLETISFGAVGAFPSDPLLNRFPSKGLALSTSLPVLPVGVCLAFRAKLVRTLRETLRLMLSRGPEIRRIVV